MGRGVRVAALAIAYFAVVYPTVALTFLMLNALFPDSEIFYTVPAHVFSPSPYFFLVLAAIAIPVCLVFAFQTVARRDVR